MNKINFAKTREDAVIPNKRAEDAGWDIYPVIDTFVIIPPQATVKINTGIASAFSSEFVMVLKERSSTSKYGLSLVASVIDSGYRGEWLVAINNNSDETVVIYNEDNVNVEREDEATNYISSKKAICQALFLPVVAAEVEEVAYEELKDIKSERGLGGFGSTN